MAKSTIKQVAAEADVSTATVSRVMNGSGYVSPEVEERVRRAIAKLQYQPSAIARSLKQDKTFMIGVIVPDIANPYFMGLSRGIEDVVGREGFQLAFSSSDEQPAKEARLLQLFSEKRVDAIVLATAGGNDEAVRRLQAAGMPIVLVDRKLAESPDGEGPDAVTEDNAAGAYALVRKLLDDGHVRIGVVSGSARVSTGRERLEGVLRALREAGLPGRPPVCDGEFTTEGGSRATRQLLAEAERPTAIVSLNNRMSLGVLLELTRQGLRIPDDMAVASFGEVEAGLLLGRPRLYYVEQQPYEMGVRAGEILLKRIRKEAVSRASVRATFRGEVRLLP